MFTCAQKKVSCTAKLISLHFAITDQQKTTDAFDCSTPTSVGEKRSNPNSTVGKPKQKRSEKFQRESCPQRKQPGRLAKTKSKYGKTAGVKKNLYDSFLLAKTYAFYFRYLKRILSNVFATLTI